MRGIVYKSTGSWYWVKSKDGLLHKCRIKGKFRIKGIKSTNPIAVGDKVVFDLEKKGDEETGVIKTILDRDNFIVRKSVNLSKQTHIIAANVDQVFLLITINNPPTFTAFIDRFLVTTRAYRVDTILVFNKIDAYKPIPEGEFDYTEEGEHHVSLEDLKTTWMAELNDRCIFISAQEKDNIPKLREDIYALAKSIHATRFPYHDFLY